jgi:hypothetical protein
MFVRMVQVWDADPAVAPAVSVAQVPADPPLRRPRVGVVAVVQDHLLHVAEDRLHGVIVRTPLGQRDPAQPQAAHGPARLPGLAGVRRVPVQDDADRPAGVPAPHPPHEPADAGRVLGGVEGPVGAAAVDLVSREQVEPPARPLVPRQHQAAGPGVAPPAVGLHRDRLDVEEQQHAPARPVPPPGPDPGQDGAAARVGAGQFALHAAEGEPPFCSRRRRCSRLIARRTRRLRR